MKIIQLYLARNLFTGWALALAIGAAVFGLLFLISEMDRLRDNYQFFDAALYVALTLPQRVFELLPVIVLLGSMIVLSNLESGSELTVLGASGLGAGKLMRLMVLPLIALMALIWLAEEYVNPRLNSYGEEHKIETFGSISRYLDQASWSKLDHGYVHLGGLSRDGEPRKIEIFLFNDDGSLRRSVYAWRAEVIKDREWQLYDVTIKETLDGVLTTRREKSLTVDNLWLAEELPILKLSSASMSPTMLYHYSKFLENTGQHYRTLALSFWKQLTLPLACAVMLILAIPLGGRPGISRSSSMGIRLGLGTLIGIVFYLCAQIIYALGEIMGWHPAFTCLLPIVVTLAIALIMLARSRW